MESVRKTIRYYKRLQKSGRYEVDFFELVRRVEQLSGMRHVGKSREFKEEPIRFGQLPYLHFPETMIADITEKEHLLLLVYFMGLCGNNGPLPLEYTSLAHQRSHNYYDFTIQRFNDIINHRFIGLFYRAWKANEQAVGMGKLDGGLITGIISALAGNPDMAGRLPSFTGAAWSGIFGNLIKSKEGIERILCGFFRLPIKVKDHLISWHNIPQEYRCRLGQDNNVLGKSIQLGSRFCSCTHKFAIEIGPLDFSQSVIFSPGNHGFEYLTTLIQQYFDRPFDYDLEIVIKSETIPKPELSSNLQLGRNIWLGKRRQEHSLTKLVLGASRIAEAKHRASCSKFRRKELLWAN